MILYENMKPIEHAAVHNNQAQSTAHNYSPMQLFHVNNKLLQFQNSDSSAKYQHQRYRATVDGSLPWN